MASLLDAAMVLERLESRNLSVNQYRCVRVRNRNATCMRCAQACTSGCIAYEDNEIRITPEICTGCGTCATVCPTCAIEARTPADDELLESCIASLSASGRSCVIADARMLDVAAGLFDERKVARVADLGRVDESLLVTLVLAGARSVTLVHGPRDGNERDAGVATAAAVRDTVNELLLAWGSDARVRISEKLPKAVRKGSPDEYDAARRGFFSALRDEARDVAATTIEYTAEKSAFGAVEPKAPKYPKVSDDGTLPHFLPARRKRLLGALRGLGEPHDELVSTRLWGNVVVDAGRCTGCRMCATFCPTGALVKYVDEAGGGVEHVPAACVKCRCCSDICPAGAITISDEVFAGDLANAARERIPMTPEPQLRSNPHSIETAMRALLGTSQVFER